MAKSSAAAKVQEPVDEDQLPEPELSKPELVEVPEPDPLPEEQPKVFLYTPEAGGDPIALPTDWARPNYMASADDREFLWRMDSLPQVQQVWEWLRRAKVPVNQQRLVIRLEPAEQYRCLAEWMKACTGVDFPEQ